jgi:hypothetical protein
MVRKFLLAALALAASPFVAGAATTDLTTQGDWIGTYGADGYILENFGITPATDGDGGQPPLTSRDLASLPSYISSYSYASDNDFFGQYTWDASTTDNRALELVDGSDHRASTVYSDGSVIINLNFNAAAHLKIAIYTVDWDNNHRSETLSVGSETGVPVNGGGSYFDGVWTVFDVNAPVGILNIHTTRVVNNTVISGIMFETIPAEVVPIPAPAALPAGLLLLGSLALRRRRR